MRAPWVILIVAITGCHVSVFGSDPVNVFGDNPGSGSEARADEWSDVDVALFLRDEDFGGFEHGWKAWAAQFGTLALAYVGGVGHPWAVYDAHPIPLRD